MDVTSLENLVRFEKDLDPIQKGKFLELIRKENDNIKVSTKTALKNLPNLFEHTIKIGNTKGFNATSLRDLSKATGMSLGKIYYYINSKEDLLLMLHTHYISVIEEVFIQVGVDNENQFTNLFNAIKAHLYLSQIYRPWFYFAFTESKHLNQQIIALSKKSELKSDLYFKNIIEQGMVSKEFKKVNPNFTSSMIKALLQDWYLKPWKYQNRSFDVGSYYKEVTNLLTVYLKP